MLFTLMFICAVVAIFVIAMAGFTELRELWSHPDRREAERDTRLAGTKPK